MFEMLKEFIKTELVILIPVLYLFGVSLKKSEIADKKIPAILGGVSIILCLLYILASGNPSNINDLCMIVFMSVTQGVLCAGASVYVNQLVKQAGKE